jgi:succinate dehydrogenase/fumarate reductase flavoprotein subunit
MDLIDDWRYHMYDTVKGSDWLGDQVSLLYYCSLIDTRLQMLTADYDMIGCHSLYV